MFSFIGSPFNNYRPMAIRQRYISPEEYFYNNYYSRMKRLQEREEMEKLRMLAFQNLLYQRRQQIQKEILLRNQLMKEQQEEMEKIKRNNEIIKEDEKFARELQEEEFHKISSEEENKNSRNQEHFEKETAEVYFENDEKDRQNYEKDFSREIQNEELVKADEEFARLLQEEEYQKKFSSQNIQNNCEEFNIEKNSSVEVEFKHEEEEINEDELPPLVLPVPDNDLSASADPKDLDQFDDYPDPETESII